MYVYFNKLFLLLTYVTVYSLSCPNKRVGEMNGSV